MKTKKTMKVVVVTLDVDRWLVCPKSKFTEIDGLLRLEYAWDMADVRFHREDDCCVINKDGDPVRARDGAPYRRIHNITIKNFVLCYEDEIREL